VEVADREDLLLVGKVDVEKLLGASDFQEKAFIQLRQTAVGARSGSSCGVKVAEIRDPVLLSRSPSWRVRTLSVVRKLALMSAAVTATLWFQRLDHNQTSCDASGLLNLVNREMKFRWTVPVGPLRCLATMISDLALSFSDISSSRL
jgi:hypothetical protein